MGSTIMTFFNDYPLLPLIQIAVNSVLMCSALFLLRVLKRTQLHTNCSTRRFIFTLWTFGYCLVFLCHALLGVVNLRNGDGYLPENIIEPASRNRQYKVEMTAIFCTSCLEVMITTERVISSVNPEQYHHRSRLAAEFLLPCLVLSLALAMIVGNASSVGNFIATGMVSFWLDMVTISLNTFATWYCRKRDVEIYGKCSLNARYQVKESSDMASAMQPALIISIIAKNSIDTIFLASCVWLDEVTHLCIPLIFELGFGILETLSLNMSLNGGFLMVLLLHPRLRRNSSRLLRALRNCAEEWVCECHEIYRSGPSIRDSSSRIVRVELKTNEAGVYFDALKRSWE